MWGLLHFTVNLEDCVFAPMPLSLAPDLLLEYCIPLRAAVRTTIRETPLKVWRRDLQQSRQVVLQYFLAAKRPLQDSESVLAYRPTSNLHTMSTQASSSPRGNLRLTSSYATANLEYSHPWHCGPPGRQGTRGCSYGSQGKASI